MRVGHVGSYFTGDPPATFVAGMGIGQMVLWITWDTSRIREG